MARSFNGSSDLIGLTMSADDTSAQICVSAWIKTSGSGTIFGSDNGSGAGRVIQFKLIAGVLNSVMFSGATVRTLAAVGTVNNNIWRHVMLGYDGTTMRHYVDGVQDANTNANTNTGVLTSKNARIGAQIAGVTQAFFTGAIAEVAIFYGLTNAQQLAAAIGMAAGLPAADFGPAHYWPLWGVDSPEPDIGNG